MDLSFLENVNTNLVPHEINNDDTFIAGWYTKEDNGLIDRINDFFEEEIENNRTWAGRLGALEQTRVDPELKDSIDTILDTNQSLYKEYKEKYLLPIFQQYCIKYRWSKMVEDIDITYDTNIQQYNSGSKGYSRWHCEVDGPGTLDRHLVFMTYLNDVTDGGETQFWHQNLDVKPEKGLTLIFPSHWTHVHRGAASKTQMKRFITGWFNYVV